MNEKKLEEDRKRLVQLANLVLPSAASLSDDPEMTFLGAMGCISDTREWFNKKFSILEPDDIDGLIEWQEYILEKVDEYYKEHNISVSA